MDVLCHWIILFLLRLCFCHEARPLWGMFSDGDKMLHGRHKGGKLGSAGSGFAQHLLIKKKKSTFVSRFGEEIIDMRFREENTYSPYRAAAKCD